MSSSSPLPPPHLRKPLDSQKGAGGDMSMIGLNAETIARIFLPPPSWLLTAEYAPLRLDTDDSPTSIFFSLNLSIYNQPVIASEWSEEWFFMNGRVHPYALAWEVKQRDGLESETGDTLIYTMPALVVRDQGYQPILPRLFASMDNFPCIPPIVSFTGFILGPGHPATTRPSARPRRRPAKLLRLRPALYVSSSWHSRQDPFQRLPPIRGLRYLFPFTLTPGLYYATSTAAASSSAISTPLKENRPPLRPLSGIYSLPLTPWQHLVPSRQVLHLRL
ncbi:hypothetical protein HRG_012258 [Hirsutella rhossiliensis]